LSVALSTLEKGQGGVVRHLRGGKTFVSRMVAFGFTVGAEVTVIQKRQPHGPLVVMVRGTRVALGYGEASKVEVDGTSHGK